MWFWQPRGEEIQICLSRKAHLATSRVVCFAKKGIKITSHPRILSHWECSVLPFLCLGMFLQGGLKPKQTESLRSPSATAASGITAQGHVCHLSREKLLMLRSFKGTRRPRGPAGDTSPAGPMKCPLVGEARRAEPSQHKHQHHI